MPAPARTPAPCPHCAVPMREVAARARTGYLILLDQCPQCGGVWCDRWELFPLAPEEAERIDAVDAAHLHAASPPASMPGRCPRCTAALLAQLATTYGAASTWSKVANLDAATYASDDDPDADAVDVRPLLWSTAPWIVLRALLRLLPRV